MDDTLRVVLIVIAIAVFIYRWYSRQQQSSMSKPMSRSSAPSRSQRPSSNPDPKADGLEIGFSGNADTSDGKSFSVNGVVSLDVKPGAGVGAKPKAEQFQKAMTLVVNHFPQFVNSVPSEQIANNYQTFTTNYQNSLRDYLDAEGYSLRIVLLFQHTLE